VYRDVGRSAQIDLFEGEGRFVAGRKFRVGDTEIEARRIFLNTGNRTARPAIDGLDTVACLTSRSILDLRELPGHLLVVGGGYVGCEFAQMFRRFGSRVTVVQRADRVLPGEEAELSAAVLEAFTAEGIDVLTRTTCTAAAAADGAIRIACEGDESTERARAAARPSRRGAPPRPRRPPAPSARSCGRRCGGPNRRASPRASSPTSPTTRRPGPPRSPFRGSWRSTSTKASWTT